MMKKVILLALLFAALATSASPKIVHASERGAEIPQVEGLMEQMMGDSGIMALITALQGDPEMQAVLNDPSIMAAIQSGDFMKLIENPAFMKLLNNPSVKEIEKKLGQGGTQ